MTIVDLGAADVTCDLTGGVLTVTLARPAVRNALSLAMLDGLATALELARTSEDVRVLVLTGAGGAFCAGGDVEVMVTGDSIFGPADDVDGRIDRQTDYQRRTVVALFDLAKPTVALLPGAAAGAGLALALACDIRIAARSSVLSTAFSRVQLAGDFGCSWLLHHVAGTAVAKDLLLRSPTIDIAAALRMGLVHDVVDDEALAEHASTVTRRLARLSSHAVEAIETTSHLSGRLGFAEASDRDAQTHVHLTLTPEHRLAVQRLADTLRGT